jgi:hypothetical protein
VVQSSFTSSSLCLIVIVVHANMRNIKFQSTTSKASVPTFVMNLDFFSNHFIFYVLKIRNEKRQIGENRN